MKHLRSWLMVGAALYPLASVSAQTAYQVHGLNFSPYIDGQTGGDAVTENQIRTRMAIVAPYTKWVRSFSVTGGLQRIGPVAREFGLKTAIGAWLGSNSASNDTSITALISQIQAGHVDLAIVGSETLERGDLTAEQLIARINQVKAVAGSVPVTTADTYHRLRAHPDVIAACDVVFVNYYGYWAGLAIDQAVPTLNCWHYDLKRLAGSKPIIVSETGWPSGGNTVGGAVPTPENAARYFLEFTSWARAKNVDYFYFEAFDESWKVANEGPQGAHWGIWDKNGVLKPGMSAVFENQTSPPTWADECLVGGPGTPAIEFVLVPPVGSTKNLHGQVWHVRVDEWRVAVYMRVGNGWWNKPTNSAPATTARSDGGWTCNITTGGNDVQASQVAAYLVPAAFAPPLVNGAASLPASLGQNAAASVQFTRTAPVPGDFDRDGDVDHADLTTFTNCVTGPALARPDGCAGSDFDGDNDVDCEDFGVFQRCYSGLNHQASPACAS